MCMQSAGPPPDAPAVPDPPLPETVMPPVAPRPAEPPAEGFIVPAAPADPPVGKPATPPPPAPSVRPSPVPQAISASALPAPMQETRKRGRKDVDEMRRGTSPKRKTIRDSSRRETGRARTSNERTAPIGFLAVNCSARPPRPSGQLHRTVYVQYPCNTGLRSAA